MYRCFAALLCMLFTTAAFSQTINAFEAQKLGPQVSPELDFQFNDYEVYEMDINALDVSVKGLNPQYEFVLDLGTEHSWELELIPNDLRGPNYQIRNSFGTSLQGIDEIITFRGYLKDQPFSEVRLTIDEDFLYGYIEVKDKKTFIEPLWHFIPDAPRNQIIVYRPEDVKPRNTTCGFSEMEHRGHDYENDIEEKRAQSSSSATINCYEVEVAMAADFSMFQKYGSVPGVEGHVLGVLNNVQGNYDDEFEDEIQFVVVGSFYSDCSSCDPWTTSTAAGTLLSSFRSWGNGGGFGFTYDVAELWTNRNFDGSTIGIAFLNAICNSRRYHCIQDFSNNANLLRVVVAHEFGHNFSSPHDASGSGFIMAPSVNNTNIWSPASINDIDNYVNFLASQSNCLTSCASQLPPQADFVADVTDGCIPMTVNFTDLSVNTPSSWSWTFPGGSPATSNQQNPTVIYNTPGIYDVILQVVNGAGSDVSTRINYIEVAGPPVVGFDVFVSDFTALFLNTSSADATDYLWDFGDGTSSFAVDPTHEYQEDGVYTVSLTASNNCGSSTTTQQVVILTQPLPNFEANVTSGCAPLTVFFSNLSSSNSEELLWLFPGGDPATSEGENPVVTYSTPGTYDVTLQVTNAAGSNTLTQSAFITVEASPVPNYTFNQNGSDVDFTNTSTDANSYSWDFGDGNSSTDVDPMHTYAMDGTYTVILTAFGSCDTLTFEQMITIANLPTANLSADVTSGCVPLTVNFTDQSSANVLGWSWSFPGGDPASSTDQNPSVTYNAAGTYNVALIVSNGSGNDTLTLFSYVTVDDVPSVGFSSMVNGTTVDFTNNSTNATSYNWDFGDGNTSTDANPMHTYAMDGVYTVTLTATNNCGPVTTTEVITIVTAPTADLSANATSGCAPLTVQFNNLSSSNATSYAWTFPGGDPATSTMENPTVTYNTAGTYDVMLTVTNAAGTDMITRSNYIVVDDVPSVGFSSMVSGNTVDFTNTTTNATSYSWDFGDGNTSTDANPMHTYAMDGVYTVTLTATNNCGPVTTTEVITIVTAPTADLSANATSGCAPLTVQFNNLSSSNATSYAWTFPGGDPATSTMENPTVTYNTAGSYDVMLTVTNAAGTDMITRSNYIVVDDVPSVGFSSMVSGNTVDFTNTTTNATSYSWDFGDGNTSTDANPMHTYAMDGVYTVTLTATNNCGPVTTTEVITIVTAPTADLSANATSGCAPLTVQFNNLSSSNATSYAWTFPGGDPATSTMENPTVTYNTAGTYDVMLTVTNAAGTDMITRSNYIVVDDVPSVGFSSMVSGNTVDFTNTTTNATSYSWDFGDGNTSTDANPMHTYAMDGVYTVTLTATNNCGPVTTTEVITIVTAPTADLSANMTSGCAPLTVQFNNLSSSNATSYSWSFPGGDPASSTMENPMVTYNTAGTYDVMLTVTNAAGTDMISLSNYIVVDDVPSIGFSSMVSGSTVDFTNTTTNATSYSWDFGDGNTSTDANPTHTYAMDGSYTVTLTATNNCGTVTTTDNVNIGTAPNAGATANVTSGCAPLTVQFTDQSSANTTAWSWTFPGGTPATSTMENPMVTYSTAGTYDVMLTVTNSTGTDMLTLSNYITVNDVPSVGFGSMVNGTMVSFNNTSNNATSYSWDFGDGNSSTAANPTHTYATDGTYDVTLTATNPCGSVTSMETVVIVTAPTAGFSADNVSGCVPLIVQFNNQSSANATGWSWSFPGGNPATSTMENPTVTYNTAGTYDVTLTVTNAAGMDISTQTSYITVDPMPSPSFTVLRSDFTANFTNTSTDATSYSWDFGDGNSSTDVNPSHTYTMEGTYIVTLTATNPCGTMTFTQEVEITLGPQAGFTADVTEGCAPLTVAFSDLSSGGVTNWQWSFPGGTPATSTMQNPTVVYDTPGNYGVSLEITTATGTNMLAQNGFITVLPAPSAAFNTMVNGSTVDFTNNSSNATSYSWDFGDGNTSSSANPTHTYMMDGTYTVTLTAISECGEVTTTQTVVIVTAPVAGFTANQVEGCAPLEVEFTDQSSSTPTAWSWSFPGGTPATSTEQNPKVEYTTAGNYTVTLEVTNAAGSNSITQINYISVLAQPTASFSSTVSDNQVSFVNQSTDGDSYSWDFGDGNTSMEINPTHVYTMSGTYTVTLTVMNECGSVEFTEEITIEVVTIPSSGFIGSMREGCAPLEVTFTDQSSANTTNWAWSFEGGTPATSAMQNPVVNYDTPGTYAVQLIASNTAGADTTVLMDYITVLAAPTAGFSFNSVNFTVDFTNTSTNGDSYSWDFGDGTASNLENPSHTYTMEGTYTVVLTVTNECGTTTSSQVIVIQEGGSAPTASFSATPTRGCAPLEVTFIDVSTGGPSSWSWAFEGGTPATSTLQNPVVTYSAPGIYEVTLTVTNAQGNNTLTQSNFIEVLAQPSAGFTFVDDNSGAIVFSNTSSDGTSYNWDFGDGNSSTDENPTHSYASSGIYEVVLTVTNECGTSTFTETVDLRITSTSQPSFIQSVDLYPNPNNGEFVLHLQGESRPVLELTLFNVLGQVVEADRRSFNGQLRKQYNLSGQPSGVYLLQLRSEKELSYFKVVVE